MSTLLRAELLNLDFYDAHVDLNSMLRTLLCQSIS